MVFQVFNGSPSNSAKQKLGVGDVQKLKYLFVHIGVIHHGSPQLLESLAEN